MKKGQLTALIIFAIVFTSCEFKCNIGKDTEKKDQQKDSTIQKSSNKNNSPQTLNGIELSTNEVQVNRAFLSLESGNLVPSDNTVALGEKISLVINIDNGWKEIDGKSFIGASEKITTDNGTTLLDTGDMFAAYDQTGLDPTDAKVITLKAIITSKPSGPVEYYVVNFRVWDKKGNGEITGKYKFYIK